MKENIKAPRPWPLCGEVPGEFPAQMASNAENVYIWWRHHVNTKITLSLVSAYSVLRSITYIILSPYIYRSILFYFTLFYSILWCTQNVMFVTVSNSKYLFHLKYASYNICAINLPHIQYASHDIIASLSENLSLCIFYSIIMAMLSDISCNILKVTGGIKYYNTKARRMMAFIS